MPLLLTPKEPFLTTALVPVSSLYARIKKVGYDVDEELIVFEARYYISKEAKEAGADPLLINALPVGFTQPATAQQANGVPIFDFLDAVLQHNLEALHPTATIVRIV